jgi:hypothetical protein
MTKIIYPLWHRLCQFSFFLIELDVCATVFCTPGIDTRLCNCYGIDYFPTFPNILPAAVEVLIADKVIFAVPETPLTVGIGGGEDICFARASFL